MTQVGAVLQSKYSLTVDQAFGAALDAERLLGARRLNAARIAIVGLFLCMFLVLGYGLGDPNYRGSIELWFLYFALATAVYWLGSRTRLAPRLGMLPVLAIDMPMLFALQVALIPTYHDPGSLVGFTVGGYLFLLLLAYLAFEPATGALAAAVALVCEYLLLWIIGSDIAGYIVASLLTISSAAVLGYAARRLTQVLRAVATERADKVHLAALNEEKDRFVATVSHDFRSPLAVVLSSIQTLQGDASMSPTLRAEFLSRAERQCKRLQALVTDLLDLARMENRSATMRRADVNDIARYAVDGIRPLSEEKQIDVRCETLTAPVYAIVDRPLVQQALTNLLGNALKFTEAGGEIVVRIEDEAEWVCLSVRDTGSGIPPDEQERLFERFFQGKNGASRGDGSGLGLAIVAEVARKHGGSISVESEIGSGTEFRLRLPSAQSEEEIVAATPPEG